MEGGREGWIKGGREVGGKVGKWVVDVCVRDREREREKREREREREKEREREREIKI